MKVISWNICYSRRNTGEYENFSIKNRISKITKLISEQNADVIFLQEIHESVKNQLNELYNKNYILTWLQHSSRGGCCYNLVAINKTYIFECDNLTRIFPSYINEYKGNKELISCITAVQTNEITFINVHSPMAKNIRFRINKLLKTVTNAEKVLICGDFNTFPDVGGLDQIKDLCVLNHVSHYECSKLTFRAYPYDIFESYMDPAPLDHIFYKGINVMNVEKISSILDNDLCVKNESFFISDHYMMVFDINF